MAGYNQNPGWFGTGQYQVQEYDLDPSAARLSEAERFRRTFQQGAATADGRAAPQAQAATIDTGPQNETRASQMRVLGGLVDASEGRGTSVAQQQLAQATDRNVKGALSVANTARGMGGGSAVRQVAMTQGQVGQQAAADSSLLRAQEIATARQQAMQGATGMRGQDVALASEQAGLQQQTNLANLQSEQGQRQLNQNMVQYNLSMGMSLEEANRQAAMDMQRLRLQQNINYNQMGQQSFDSAGQRRAAFTSGLINTGASLGMAFAGLPPVAPIAPQASSMEFAHAPEMLK